MEFKTSLVLFKYLEANGYREYGVIGLKMLVTMSVAPGEFVLIVYSILLCS